MNLFTKCISVALSFLLLASQSSFAFAEGDAPETGAYVLSLTGSADQNEMTVTTAPDNEGIARVKLEVSGADVALTNPQLVFNNPAPGKLNIEVADFETTKQITKTVNGQGGLVLTFDQLQGGDKLSFNVRLTLAKDGMVPQGARYSITADLKTQAGVVLKSSQELTVVTETGRPELRKTMPGADFRTFFAGTETEGAIAKPVPVEYSFSVIPEQFGTYVARAVTKFEFEDTLPTYEDNNGQRRTAQIAPESATEWRLSDDGAKATKVVQTGDFETYFNNYYPGQDVKLFLLFPDAKVDQPITNHAKVTMTPYNRQLGEVDIVDTTDITKTLIAQQERPLVGFPSKEALNPVVEDIIEAKLKPQEWILSFRHMDQRGLNRIHILENPAPELYIDTISKVDDNDYGYFGAIKNIEGTTAEGVLEEVQIQRTATQIKLVNGFKYTSLKINFNDDFVMRGDGLFFYKLKVATKFRDPQAVSQANNPEGFVNSFTLNGKTLDNTGSSTSKTTAKFELRAFNYAYKLGVKKNYDSNNITLTPGGEVSYIVTARNEVPTNGKITGRKLVVVLPNEMGLAPRSSDKEPVRSREGGIRYEQVENFNNKGKRAVVITLPDLTDQNMNINDFMDDSDITITLRANTFLGLDPVTIPTYYTFDGIGFGNFVPWKGFFVQYKGKAAPDIYDVSDGRAAQIGLGELTWNAHPSTVLGAMTQVGAEGGPQTPYSYNLGENKNFTMAMSIANYQDDPQTGIVLYNVLPHPHDKVIIPNTAGVYTDRGSNTLAVLTGPAQVPAGYKAYYLTEAPPADARAALDLPTWQEGPVDWSTVKAVKVVSEPGTQLLRGQKISVVLPAQAQDGSADPKLVDSFAYLTQALPTIVEANKAFVTLPATYRIAKQWMSGDGTVINNNVPADITLPEKLDVDIMAATPGSRPKLQKTVELNPANNWTLELNDLPAYEGSQKLSYSFVEHAVEGWAEQTPETIDDVYTFKNTFIPPTSTITVTKAWDDRGQAITYPDVSVQLLANGTVVEGLEPLVLNEENGYRASFDNRPMIDEAGLPIAYSVREVNKPAFFVDKVTGDIDQGFTITNTYQVPKTYTVTKKWLAPNGEELDPAALPSGISLPDQIEVRVFKQEGSEPRELLQTLTLNAANNWQASLENLISYSGTEDISYSFEEVPVEGWTAAAAEIDGTAVTLKSTFNMLFADVSISKKWKDARDPEDHPNVELTLHANGKPIAGMDKIVLDAAHGFATVLNKLPLIDEAGALIEYALTELSQFEHYTSSVKGNVQDGFVVTNTFKENPALPDNNTNTDNPKPNDKPQSDNPPNTNNDGNTTEPNDKPQSDNTPNTNNDGNITKPNDKPQSDKLPQPDDGDMTEPSDRPQSDNLPDFDDRTDIQAVQGDSQARVLPKAGDYFLGAGGLALIAIAAGVLAIVAAKRRKKQA